MPHPHRRSRILAFSAVVVLVTAGVAVGRAVVETVPGTRLSCVDWAARTSPVSTHSRTWVDVPGMRVRETLAQNFTIQLNANFDGADVQVRILDTTVGGTSRLLPASATFRVGAVPEGFSFGWVGSNPSEHQHTFQLQWRIPVGLPATMLNGNLTLLYQGAPDPGIC